ncbi:hypothetical protein SporoP32a_13620 [Sporosarcina ureae]|nr:hypothetical protein SporoP32a_13620 [Sporosarcina ureae]
MNVAFGGTLYQDIHAQLVDDLLQHNQLTDLEFATQLLDIVPDSILAEYAGASEIRVNTLHHQAVSCL